MAVGAAAAAGDVVFVCVIYNIFIYRSQVLCTRTNTYVYILKLYAFCAFLCVKISPAHTVSMPVSLSVSHKHTFAHNETHIQHTRDQHDGVGCGNCGGGGRGGSGEMTAMRNMCTRDVYARREALYTHHTLCFVQRQQQQQQ